MDESFTSVLNTPMKKIKELSLESPPSARPVVYPDLSEIPTPRAINDSMIDKGYSQTLSTAVLRELDTRANEISTQAFLASSHPLSSAKKTRFAGTHKPMFQKMESISYHYAAARKKKEEQQTKKDPQSSATKKRRTLNGPEEIFGPNGLDSSPVRRRENASPTPLYKRGAPLPDLSGANPFSGKVPTLQANSTQAINAGFSSSPIRSADPTSSPSNFSRISPSKGSMNLNQLLSDDTCTEFVKPKGPVKVRQTSLQMAGVKPSGSNQSLNKKPSASNLHKKSSHTNLAERSQSRTSVSSLSKKPSFSTLEKKPSFSTLEKKSSLPSKSRSTSCHTGPNLRASPSHNTMAKSGSESPIDSANESMCSISSPRAFSSRSTTSESCDSSYLHRAKPEFKSNTTKAVPFSLYSKPTISSSQKSLEPQSNLPTFPSHRSLSSQASQRSMNRFERFKTRFS